MQLINYYLWYLTIIKQTVELNTIILCTNSNQSWSMVKHKILTWAFKSLWDWRRKLKIQGQKWTLIPFKFLTSKEMDITINIYIYNWKVKTNLDPRNGLQNLHWWHFQNMNSIICTRYLKETSVKTQFIARFKITSFGSSYRWKRRIWRSCEINKWSPYSG